MRRIEQSIDVDASLQTCFQLWVQNSCFPLFRADSSGEAAKSRLSWEEISTLTQSESSDGPVTSGADSSRALWYHQVEAGQVDTSGLVMFYGVTPGKTRIIVTLTCNWPLYHPEEFASDIFKSPEQTVKKALDAFKSLVKQKALTYGR